MTNIESIKSPIRFLKLILGDLPDEEALREYETWWKVDGKEISTSIDREGTPWLKMFDVFGHRVDEILYPPAYWRMLKMGYRSGAIWRAFESGSLIQSYLLGYLTAFYDTGLYCPYTVSLPTAIPLSKYGDEQIKNRFLPQMLRKDDSAWQGATWITEAGGESDLGARVDPYLCFYPKGRFPPVSYYSIYCRRNTGR